MGSSTLTNRASGQTILDTFFNDIHSAINGDFVGRNTSGVATSGQNLGTNAIPWGVGYFNSMVLNGSAVDTSLLTAPKNRIVSGKTRTTSNQPQFIDPNGAAASFVLEGLSTNLVLDIDGAAVQMAIDVTKSALTVGPSTTATAQINDTAAADDEYTKTSGEQGAQDETLSVDTMGAEFQTFIGQWVAVKIAGVATEYALVFVKSATELTNCYRGFFYDSSAAPINRTAFTNNDVITVLSTGWVFVENDGATVDVSYTNPIKSFTAPSGPATGDYWYDLANETWKRYDGASWQIINRTLVGVVGIDSANCVCAKSFDFYAKYADTNNAEFEINSTEIVQIKNHDAKTSVYGNEFNFNFNHENWNVTTDLAVAADMYNATEQASTVYYAYLKDDGDTVISDISPHYRPDLLGWYHPHNPHRCLAQFYNDGSNNIVLIDEMKFNLNIKEKIAFLKDYKAANTTGGTFTAGADQTRDLNTLEGDTSFILLDTDQFTAIPGEYEIWASAPLYDCELSRAWVQNITDSITEILGSSEYSIATAAHGPSHSFMVGYLIISSTKTFEIQHRCTVTSTANNGFGIAVNLNGEQELYTQVKITKLR